MKKLLLVVSLVERLAARAFAIVLISILVAAGHSASAIAADPGRGKLLYQNTCSGCHESTLHLRERRTALSFGQIKREVVRWSSNADALWNLEEIEDVADYLNLTYYRYPCEPEQCSFQVDAD